MKNKQIIPLLEGLEKIKSIQDAKLAYAYTKNKRILSDELEVIQETIKALDCVKKIQEYEVKRKELLEEYAVKQDGKPVIEDNKYKITPELEEKCNKEIKELFSKYENDYTEYNKKQEEINDQENPIKLHKIKQSDLTADLTGEQLDGIFDIIEE